MTRFFALLMAFGLAILAPAAAAQDVEDVIVFIVCGPDNGSPTSRGSGVVVSAQGHVLTAKHVVEGQSNCRASKRVADRNIARIVNTVPVPSAVDMAMVRLSEPGPHEFVPYCPLEPWMVRRRIFVAGFPGETKTGAASYREGVLSTWRPNNEGILETDGQTVEGMSGGPVFSKNLQGVVGIVVGALASGVGDIQYYGILPIADYVQAFPAGSVTQATAPCYHEVPHVAFTDPATGAWGATWTTGEDPMPLNISPDEGTCFLRKVFGQFNDPSDSVVVTEADGQFVLTGENHLGGTHGAEAGCVRHDH